MSIASMIIIKIATMVTTRNVKKRPTPKMRSEHAARRVRMKKMSRESSARRSLQRILEAYWCKRWQNSLWFH
jgi:hypothetical protein